jgi:hypothetical protein
LYSRRVFSAKNSVRSVDCWRYNRLLDTANHDVKIWSFDSKSKRV